MNRLTALFAPGADAAPRSPPPRARAGPRRRRRTRPAPVAEQDWVRATQAQFAPIRDRRPALGRAVVVRRRRIPTRSTSRSTPGLAFGTGSHPTTRLCLALARRVACGAGERVLDYGCGSGILAIAAAKLGAGDGRAASTSTRRRSSRAAPTRRATASSRRSRCRDDCRPPAAGVRRRRRQHPRQSAGGCWRPRSPRACARAGAIVLSGVLDAQADAVCAAYAPWFNFDVWRGDDGWVALAGERRARRPRPAP